LRPSALIVFLLALEILYQWWSRLVKWCSMRRL